MKLKYVDVSGRRCSQKGFTLIELLVVISIIALLLSILMPGLQKAKAMAKKVVCLTNIHTIGLAWITYSVENDDKLVMSDMMPGHWIDLIGSPQSPYSGKASWPSLALNWSGTMGELAIEREDAIKRGALWPYMSNVKAYKCPAHQKQSTPEQLQRYPMVPRDKRKVSYAIVGLLNGQSVWQGGKLSVYTKMSQIKSPSNKLALTEQHDPRGAVGGSWAWQSTLEEVTNNGIHCPEYLASWHGGQNWARCDGSSEGYKWVEPETIEAAKVGLPTDFSAGNEDMVWIARGMPRARGR